MSAPKAREQPLSRVPVPGGAKARLNEAARALDAILLELGDQWILVLADELGAIAEEQETAFAATQRVELASVVGIAGSTEQSPTALRRVLVASHAGQSVAFMTGARLHLMKVATDRLFRLPRLLRAAGCAEWVRGIALLPANAGRDPRAGAMAAPDAASHAAPQGASHVAAQALSGAAPLAATRAAADADGETRLAVWVDMVALARAMLTKASQRSPQS